jgi:Phage virion morphogenesis family
MSDFLTIKVESGEALKALNAAIEKTSNAASLLKNVGEALFKQQNRRFNTQTDPNGKPWAKLLPFTIALRVCCRMMLNRSAPLHFSWSHYA